MNKCKVCGAEFESRFCPNCGTKFVEENPPETEKQSTPADGLTDDVLKYGIKHVWKNNDKNTGNLTVLKVAHYLFLALTIATLAIIVYFFVTKIINYTLVRTVLIFLLIFCLGDSVFGNFQKTYEKFKISEFIKKQKIDVKKITINGKLDYEGNLSGDASNFFADDNIWTETAYFAEKPQAKNLKLAGAIVSCVVTAVSMVVIYFMVNSLLILQENVSFLQFIPFLIILFLGDIIGWIFNIILKKQAKEWIKKLKGQQTEKTESGN